MTIEDVVSRRRDEGTSRTVLLVGLILGLVAAVLIAIVLSRDDGSSVAGGRVAVVATADIPARTRLTRDMLQVQTYETGELNPDAFTTVGQLLNRVTASEIKAGQVILPSAVSTSAGEGLTFTVSEGMRAISITVDEVEIAGGNLSPGNLVDVVGIFEVTGGTDAGVIVSQLSGGQYSPLNVARDSVLTFTLLQNVRVLAVAQELPEETASSNQDSEGEGGSSLLASRSNPSASTVTLEVLPQQAQMISTGDLKGDIRLSLRPFGEESTAPVSPILVPLEN